MQAGFPLEYDEFANSVCRANLPGADIRSSCNKDMRSKVKMLLQTFTLLLLSVGSVLAKAPADKVMRLADAEYEPGIRTVLLVPRIGYLTDDMALPMVALGAENPLRLEFDEMGSQYYNYYYRIIPCNWNWTPGILQDMELAEAINEYVMDGYTLSSGTRVPYVHYFAQMPRLKLSGNYVVVVYRNGNRDDIVLTRRFCVYETLVPISLEPKFGAGAEARFTYQQIDATVNYSDYPLVNPAQNAHLILRQNGRWDNAIVNLPPLYIREEDKLLDYRYFNLENAFEGNNEWRQFDIRSLRYRGVNVLDMKYDNTTAAARLMLDVSRNIKTYSQYVDLNGRYAVMRAETQNVDLEESTADYVDVTFTVQLPAGAGMEAGKLYVFGQFTNFQVDDRYQLKPDPSSGGKYYTVTVPLKQGLYSYQYAYMAPGAKAPSFREMEGTYSQTENNYDALFYYRPIGARYDQLAGYKRVSYNGRQ